MRLRYLRPAPVHERRQKRRPFKGSVFFRHPDYDFMRLKAKTREIEYLDERVTSFKYKKADLVLIPVYAHTVHRAAELSVFYRHHEEPVIFTGPFASIAPDYCLKFCDGVAIGDITSSIDEIISDLEARKLKKRYRSKEPLSFEVDREVEDRSGFVPDYSQLRLQFGCGCLHQKEFCYEYYLHPETTFCDLKKALQLTSLINRKRVILLDDAVDSNPDYYLEFFKDCWQYHKEWIVSATGRIFDHPDLLLAMKRAGVRGIILKSDYYLSRRKEDIAKDLSYIHHLRMIPGLTVVLNPDVDLEIIDEIMRLPADFALFPTKTPIPFTSSFEKKDLELEDLDFFDQGHPVMKGIDPNIIEKIKDRYYSMDQILGRLISTLSRIGVYNSLYYLMPINLALRQNFLEGIPYPP
ncbi:MAG TPA: hypothetical protein EYP24_04000 [bacterium (Candidatus Stahlbacteria)]|nr:hypothetical protein [Candidatus Stahlbacteria bacterium]